MAKRYLKLVPERSICFDFSSSLQVHAARCCKHPNHRRAARVGAHIAYDSLSWVLEQMQQHPLTDKGIQAFLDDWHKAEAQLRAQPVS